VRLKDGDDLFRCRYLFILEHSVHGLIADLFRFGQAGFQGLFQALSLWFWVFCQRFQNLLGLRNTLLGDLYLFAVGLLGSFLLAGHRTLHLPSCFPGTASAIAKDLCSQIGLSEHPFGSL
jgi:hypothetical protein